MATKSDIKDLRHEMSELEYRLTNHLTMRFGVMLAAAVAPWERGRLAHRVKSEPVGFGFWANKFTLAAEINRPGFLVERMIQQSTIQPPATQSIRFTAIAGSHDCFSNLCRSWVGLKGRLRHIYTAPETDRAPRSAYFHRQLFPSFADLITDARRYTDAAA